MHKEEDNHEPVTVGNFGTDNYIEYKRNSDNCDLLINLDHT